MTVKFTPLRANLAARRSDQAHLYLGDDEDDMSHHSPAPGRDSPSGSSPLAGSRPGSGYNSPPIRSAMQSRLNTPSTTHSLHTGQLDVRGMQVPVYQSANATPEFVHPVPGYSGFLQGIAAENKHGGTYGMLRDGEDRVFGELWSKAGPQARASKFLLGAVPGYTGALSADIQWARKLEMQKLGILKIKESEMPDALRRLQELQDQARQGPYLSVYDTRALGNRELANEHRYMCPWKGRKHQIPGYSGHVPTLHSNSLTGGTFSKATMSAYEHNAKIQAVNAALAGRRTGNPLPLSRGSTAARDQQMHHDITGEPLPAVGGAGGEGGGPEQSTRDSVLSPMFRRQRSARLGGTKHRLTAGRRLVKKLKETIAAKSNTDKGELAIRIFNQLDADNRGYVSILQMKAALMDLNLDMSEAEISAACTEMDKTGSGEIDKDQLRDILAAYPDFDASLFSDLARTRPRPDPAARLERRGSDPVFDAPFTETFHEDSDLLSRYARAQDGLKTIMKRLTRSKTDLATLMAAFKSMDKDMSGRVGREEFRNVLREKRVFVEDALVDDMFNTFDTSGNGNIEFTEFVKVLGLLTSTAPNDDARMTHMRLLSEIKHRVGSMFENARQAFAVFDKNGDGIIEEPEFAQTLAELGMNVSESDLKRLFALISTQTPGSVDIGMFVRGILGHEQNSLSHTNYSSHQLVGRSAEEARARTVHRLRSAQERLDLSLETPHRLDANVIAQRMRKQWRQSYPLPNSSAPLRLAVPLTPDTPGGATPDPSLSLSLSLSRQPSWEESRPSTSMGVRVQEEAEDSLNRLPVTVKLRPSSSLALGHRSSVPSRKNESFVKIGDTDSIRPSFGFTTTYGTTYDPLGSMSGRVY